MEEDAFSESSDVSQQQPQKNTMAACRVRFSGQQHSEAVEEFLNGVQTFKTLEKITDEDALKGVSLLFTDTASLWWQGIRKEVTTWQDCLDVLKEHFAPRKPPHQIYKEIFSDAQDNNTGLNLFIIRKRALFAQLPEGRHAENVQIDMIYCLIHYKYRQHMRRGDISSFQDLLQKGREIEEMLAEAASVASGGWGEKLKPKRCSFCNYRGHTVEDCRRRQQKRGGGLLGDQQNLTGKDKTLRSEEI